MNANTEMRGRAQDARIAPGLVRLVVVVVMLVVLVPSSLFALIFGREKSRRGACLSNVRQLGLAMKQSSQDFNETYPWDAGASKPENAWWDLGMLYPNYCSAWRTFLCPSAKDRMFKPSSESGRKEDYPLEPLKPANNKEVISYAYGMDGSEQPTKAWTEGAKSTVRLLADKKAGIEITDENARLFNHRKTGRNVLYNDGHVKWIAGVAPLDPDADDDKIGKPNADDYKAFWSDPPFYGEGMEEKEGKEPVGEEKPVSDS